MGEIAIMTDDDAKDVAHAIEKIINRKKIRISVDKAKRIVATLKMMQACGLDLTVEEPESFANPSTCTIVEPSKHLKNYVPAGCILVNGVIKPKP
jgi:hypothetical protein